METKKRKLPEWMLSPKKPVEVEDKEESESDQDVFDFAEENEETKEKPVSFIMSPKELEELALEILSEVNSSH